MKKILVAGIGNIFHGDDAFGCEVVRDWRGDGFTEEVTIKDFGISSYELASAMTGNYEAVILVDAVSGGADPGTIYLIEPEAAGGAKAGAAAIKAHSMDVDSVLHMTRSRKRVSAKLFLVGCETAVLEDKTGNFALSGPVEGAVGQARLMIESVVNDIFHPAPKARPSAPAP